MDWTSAPVYEQGTVTITGDGTYTVTPTVRPDGTGCYSYYEILEGPDYTTETESPVGLITETFLVPPLAKTGLPIGGFLTASAVVSVGAILVKRTGKRVHYRYSR